MKITGVVVESFLRRMFVFAGWYHTRQSAGKLLLRDWRCMRAFLLLMTRPRGWLFLMLSSEFFFLLLFWNLVVQSFRCWSGEWNLLGCWGFRRDTNTVIWANCHLRLDGTTMIPSGWVLAFWNLFTPLNFIFFLSELLREMSQWICLLLCYCCWISPLLFAISNF